MGAVVLFPPLPPLPAPPRVGPDPRQRTFEAIVGAMAGPLSRRGRVGVANVARGFPASAVDLGAIQTALQRGVARLDMKQVRARWSADLFAWMRRVVLTWVQRCKLLQFRLRPRGIHVRMETQDDDGYYCYAFDVFPGKVARRRTRVPPTANAT